MLLSKVEILVKDKERIKSEAEWTENHGKSELHCIMIVIRQWRIAKSKCITTKVYS